MDQSWLVLRLQFLALCGWLFLVWSTSDCDCYLWPHTAGQFWLVLDQLYLVLNGSDGLSPVSYKGLVAEALRQLVGEQNYKQDEVLAPGYYTGTTHRTAHEVPSECCILI